MPQVTVLEDSVNSTCVSPFSDNGQAISSNDQAIILLADELHTPNYVLPDSYQPAFETGFQSTAEHLHVIKDYLAYKEIIQAQPSWRAFIWRAAIDLVEQKHDLTEESFYRAVLSISHKVVSTSRAVAQLRKQRLQVDLRLPASGRFSQLDPSLAAIEDKLGEAIDQTAGITDPEVALTIALKWTLLKYAAGELSDTCCEQRSQRTAARQQQALAILQDETTALKAASELNSQIKLGVNVSPPGGGFDLEMPSDLHLLRTVTHEGQKALARTLSIQGSRLKGLSDSMKAALMSNNNFFRSNTLLCAAYISQENVLEVYEFYEVNGHGWLELVESIPKVRKLPAWDGIAVQDYKIGREYGGMLSFSANGHMDHEGYSMPAKKHWYRGTPYIPVKISNPDLERTVETVLRERNIHGGCWDTIMFGRPPSSNLNVDGFRSLPACTAVAGLAMFFASNVHKMACWLDFDNVKLTDTRTLTLGHAVVGARTGGRESNASRVQFIAARDSPLWKRFIMWG